MTTLAWFAVGVGIVVAVGLFVLWCCLAMAGMCSREEEGR